MRAFVVKAPLDGLVCDVPAPVAELGGVVVDVHRVGHPAAARRPPAASPNALAGGRPAGAGPGPKIHIDPRGAPVR
jgi:hypothetical protein